MLTSPIAITIGAQAYSLRLKNQDNFGSVYMDNTTVPGTEVRLDIKHAIEGRAKTVVSGAVASSIQYERHSVDLKVTTTDVNGFRRTTQTYTHIRNLVGSNVASISDIAKGLAAFVTSKSADLVAWES